MCGGLTGGSPTDHSYEREKRVSAIYGKREREMVIEAEAHGCAMILMMEAGDMAWS